MRKESEKQNQITRIVGDGIEDRFAVVRERAAYSGHILSPLKSHSATAMERTQTS